MQLKVVTLILKSKVYINLNHISAWILKLELSTENTFGIKKY
jgi:hypothetical protein